MVKGPNNFSLDRTPYHIKGSHGELFKGDGDQDIIIKVLGVAFPSLLLCLHQRYRVHGTSRDTGGVDRVGMCGSDWYG